MTLIQYLCAICGAGKTRALARYAKTLASNGEKVLIVQKTIKLIKSTVCDEIGAAPFSVTVFHCDDNGTGKFPSGSPSISRMQVRAGK
jgi:signal recognition particle GTPase